MAIILAALLVGFLWRFEPTIWFRNRSLLLFVLALVATAVALRIAADRTLWAFVVPTAATVLLTAILLDAGAGAAMALALGVLAGVMNQDSLQPAVYTLAGGVAALITDHPGGAAQRLRPGRHRHRGDQHPGPDRLQPDRAARPRGDRCRAWRRGR